MREFITADHIANKVRMARSQDPRTVLIVEGDFDARFFERFVDEERCKVLNGYDKLRAISALRLLNGDRLQGILAIVDADFGRIAGTLEQDQNLLFCDGHDLEIMLIQSPAFDRVVREHASEEKLAQFVSGLQDTPLSVFIVRACCPLAAILLHSLRDDLGLSFDDLPFTDFVDRRTLHFNLSDMVRVVLNKSNRHDRTLFERLLALAQSTVVGNAEIWEMASGHHCVELLAFALRSTVGTKKSRTENRDPAHVTAGMLERELRLTFSEADFGATALYQKLNEWESANGDYRVLLNA